MINNHRHHAGTFQWAGRGQSDSSGGFDGTRDGKYNARTRHVATEAGQWEGRLMIILLCNRGISRRLFDCWRLTIVSSGPHAETNNRIGRQYGDMAQYSTSVRGV